MSSGKRFSKKRLILFVIFIVAIILAKPAYHLIITSLNDKNTLEPTPEGYIDDVSRLNITKINKIIDLPADDTKAIPLLKEIIKQANLQKSKISIAGTKHSMGGHTFTKGGTVINMLTHNQMSLDQKTKILTVQAGATWAQIIPYLDELGYSPIVMQSDNAFSIGGSISVNCHGWQYGYPPIAATVQSIKIITADGQIKICSRTQNKELFSLALGGYGLFGIILEADLKVTPNIALKHQRHIVPATEALLTFYKAIEDHNAIDMAYARLNIIPDELFNDTIINIFYKQEGPPPKLMTSKNQSFKRAIFIGSKRNDYGKALRWNAEKNLEPHLSDPTYSRNQLLNSSIQAYVNKNKNTTDILHEYFIPKRNTTAFIQSLKAITKEHTPNLLNVTIRSINQDKTTFLRFANEDVFAYVLLFSQPVTPADDTKMKMMTQTIIDAAIKNKGTYYLPYRLHATLEQFNAAYPQAQTFFKLKKQYDPNEIFSNKFYQTYSKFLQK